MKEKIKALFAKYPNIGQFIKYTLFSLIAGLSETVLFVVLNYILPASGRNKSVTWFIFDYPHEAGGQGALIAFATSAIVGQSLMFITNFKKTFNSTNNVYLSALGFVVLALIVIIGIHTYLGGLLNTALNNVIPNADIAGALAKITCQLTGFFFAFPINKYILMRNKEEQKTSPEDNIAPIKEEESAPLEDKASLSQKE